MIYAKQIINYPVAIHYKVTVYGNDNEMPKKIPRACRKHGCRNTTTDRSGYCDEHRNTGWENHQQGKSRHERGCE